MREIGDSGECTECGELGRPPRRSVHRVEIRACILRSLRLVRLVQREWPTHPPWFLRVMYVTCALM